MLGKSHMTTAAKAATWVVVHPLFEAMYSEFRELSKKKADGAVNKNKIKVVNRLLDKCREVLGDEPSAAFLDVLDEDDVPQNSDVALCLSQYGAALKQFRARYHRWTGMQHAWMTEEGEFEDHELGAIAVDDNEDDEDEGDQDDEE